MRRDFFFKAGDGSADLTGTGVQACALPSFPCNKGGWEGTSSLELGNQSPPLEKSLRFQNPYQTNRSPADFQGAGHSLPLISDPTKNTGSGMPRTSRMGPQCCARMNKHVWRSLEHNSRCSQYLRLLNLKNLNLGPEGGAPANFAAT